MSFIYIPPPSASAGTVLDPFIITQTAGQTVPSNTNTSIFPRLQTNLIRLPAVTTLTVTQSIDPWTFTLFQGFVYEFTLSIRITAPVGGDAGLISYQPNFGGAFNQGLLESSQPHIPYAAPTAGERVASLLFTWVWSRSNANENGNLPYLFIGSTNSVNYQQSNITAFWVKRIA